MSFWQLLEIFTVLFTLVSLIYLGLAFARFRFIEKRFKTKTQKVAAGLLIALVLMMMAVGILGFMNAVICLFYLTLVWQLCDMGFNTIQKIRKQPFKIYYAGISALVIAFLYLANGWYQAHHVFETSYQLQSDKISSDLRLVMFADAHVGTTFSGKKLEDYVGKMQKYNPDLVLFAGDFVDNDTKKQDFLDALDALAKLKTTYGIYFVLGNHDISSNGKALRGFSNKELISEIEKRQINVLQDNIKLFDNQFYLIGRKDAYEDRRGRSRQNMSELVDSLDKQKYIIVVDHQPNDYKNQRKAKVDLVLSGHTHGGQLFPFNYLSKWAGLNDKIYGYERLDKTDFIVTSGISDWRVKFKTGCKSEFVVVDIKKL